MEKVVRLEKYSAVGSPFTIVCWRDVVAFKVVGFFKRGRGGRRRSCQWLRRLFPSRTDAIASVGTIVKYRGARGEPSVDS